MTKLCRIGVRLCYGAPIVIILLYYYSMVSLQISDVISHRFPKIIFRAGESGALSVGRFFNSSCPSYILPRVCVFFNPGQIAQLSFLGSDLDLPYLGGGSYARALSPPVSWSNPRCFFEFRGVNLWRGEGFHRITHSSTKGVIGESGPPPKEDTFLHYSIRRRTSYEGIPLYLLPS